MASDTMKTSSPMIKDTAGNTSMTTNSALEDLGACLNNPRSKTSASNTWRSQCTAALVIARAKPKDVSMKDYLAQLQKIAKEKRTPDINRPLYIDTAGYFKAECNRLILENNKLEKEISQYKLLADVNIAREAGRAMVEEMSGCLENHGRHEDVVGISNEDPLNTVPRHNLMVYMSCFSVVQQSHELYKLSQSTTVTTGDLLASLETTLRYMTDTVHDVAFMRQQNSSSGDRIFSKNIIHSLRVVGGAFNLCLRGLTHLSRDINGRASNGKIIYELVKFFDFVLEQLHLACTRPAFPTEIPIQLLRTQSDIDEVEAHRKLIVPELRKLLTTMMSSPAFTAEQTPHSKVLEGCWCHLLQRLGNLISEAVFHEKIAESTNPGNISMHPTRLERSGVEEAAVTVEGSHLAYILRYALNTKNDVADENLARMLVQRQLSAENPERKTMLSKAFKRLQDTLMQGVFGADGEEFLSALKLPKASDDIWTSESLPNEPKPGGFVGQVWSMIGWDLGHGP